MNTLPAALRLIAGYLKSAPVDGPQRGHREVSIRYYEHQGGFGVRLENEGVNGWLGTDQTGISPDLEEAFAKAVSGLRP